MNNDYTIELYRVDPSDGSFTKIDKLEAFSDLVFFNTGNKTGGASFTLSLFDQKATQENLLRWRTQAAIKKNDIIVWFGPIVKLSSMMSGVDGLLTVLCQTYNAHLQSRFTAQLVNYASVDAGSIAWGLINDTQNKTNGDLGIQLGTIEVTSDRDRTYEYKNIEEAINQLTQVSGGFDYTLTPIVDANNDVDYIKFDVFASSGILRDDLPPLTIGENVQSVQSVTTADLVNTATGLGQGTGTEIIIKTASDSDSQLAYTRRETIISRKDISIPATLQDKVTDTVTSDKVEKYRIRLTLEPNTLPMYGDYIIGDILNLNLFTNPASIINFTSTARVEGITVSIDDQGTEFVSPDISLVI